MNSDVQDDLLIRAKAIELAYAKYIVALARRRENSACAASGYSLFDSSKPLVPASSSVSKTSE